MFFFDIRILITPVVSFGHCVVCSSLTQTYKRVLKYREENVNGVKDDKEKIKENMKK
jgi:hypothetical protein